MPLIAVVVGAIGTAVGTAVGTAIGGSILGVSMATIGGVIGAGIAGGALAYATGGSFGKGFLMGAAGAAVGGFLKGGLGDTVGGATQLADGTTTAEMLAAQGGAEFAPDALSGMGDLGTTGATTGLGELGGVGGTSAETFGLGDMSAPIGTELAAEGMSTVPTAEGGFSLGNLTSEPTPGADSFSLSSMPTDTTSSIGYTPTPSFGGDQFATTPGMASSTPLLSSDYSIAPETGMAGGGLENIGQSEGTMAGGLEATATTQTPVAPAATPPSQGLGGTIRNMANTSDEWLKNTFGQGAPSTGKLLMAGGQALYDKYQTDKLARQAKGLAPMSFEEYQQQFSNVDDYRNASARMAQSGRTGTLPALLARLKERTRAGYANYLPGARQQYLGTQADIAGARSRSLSNLFRNVVA